MSEKMSFKQLFQSSLKSKDTEEWLDIYFNRPVGLCIALLGKRFDVHPNTVTIISIFLGMAAAWMFYYPDLTHNMVGVLCLMVANFCDSADGQLARLTGKKTLLGRVLDGFAGDVWFFCIYFSLCMRMMHHETPFLDGVSGYTIWLLAYVAGIMCHSPQAAMADYYRQIHLFFLFNKGNDELNTSQQMREKYQQLPRKERLARIFYYFYGDYCSNQERRTPKFQQFFKNFSQHREDADVTAVREMFLEGSRPLMKYTNILTFNTRAICLYIACLVNMPWIYFLFEILVLTPLYIYMQRRHERLCVRCTARMNA